MIRDLAAGLGVAPEYLAGVLGSIGAEVAAALLTMKANDGRLSPHHRSPVYLVLHTVFAVVAAGPLALLLRTGSLPAALYVGATAPLIFDKLGRGIRPDGVERG